METEGVKTRLTPNGLCAITQFFSATHQGMDLTGYQNGWHVCCDELCHSDGIVEAIGNDATFGRWVLVRHDNGYETFYAHIADGCVYVGQNQTVKKGQRIGYMGNTGHSFGAHCHFEVRLNGTRIDPLPFLNADFPQPTPAGDEFHKGDKAMVRNGACIYGTSGRYADWIYEKPMTVFEEPSGDRVVISYDGVVQGACYDRDLTKYEEPAPQPKGFAVGDKVRITNAIDYNGTALASWLTTVDLWISELNGDRAVLTDANKIVQCAISTANIRKV